MFLDQAITIVAYFLVFGSSLVSHIHKNVQFLQRWTLYMFHSV